MSVCWLSLNCLIKLILFVDTLRGCNCHKCLCLDQGLANGFTYWVSFLLDFCSLLSLICSLLGCSCHICLCVDQGLANFFTYWFSFLLDICSFIMLNFLSGLHGCSCHRCLCVECGHTLNILIFLWIDFYCT